MSPSENELVSEDLWTQLVAVYRLQDLVVDQDPDSLRVFQAALRRLLISPETFSRLSLAARQAWEKILCALEDVHEEIRGVVAAHVSARIMPTTFTVEQFPT